MARSVRLTAGRSRRWQRVAQRSTAMSGFEALLPLFGCIALGWATYRNIRDGRDWGSYLPRMKEDVPDLFWLSQAFNIVIMMGFAWLAASLAWKGLVGS
jgi:hypothetical protein